MKSLNIVLVEDSKTSALMMVDLVKDVGANIEYIYSNGEDLLSEIDEIEIDVLFTDIELDGELNGVELIEEFKKKKPTTPFFYITSHEDIYTLKAASKTNPWGFLNKPLDKLTLRNTLELLANNKKTIDKLLHKIDSLKNENDTLKIMSQELSETNNHLISATWRERDLKKELSDSKQLIEEQHEQISSSINYSRRIQQSMIATEEQFKEYFADSFMFYKPKDVVSGDFPWFFKKDNYLYFAAVDCTGHGVPGAMLATIGTLLLNDIVNNEGHVEPGLILDNLHLAIVSTLKQEDNCDAANDGMDIGMCRYNSDTQELLYSGAHRPLYVYSNGEMQRLKGDGYPIGGCQYKRRKPFNTHVINLKKDDTFFVYSDGIPDQFGGGTDDKFGNEKIKNIISNGIENKVSLNEIGKNLSSSLKEWMNIEDAPQTDDMLIIGLKV